MKGKWTYRRIVEKGKNGYIVYRLRDVRMNDDFGENLREFWDKVDIPTTRCFFEDNSEAILRAWRLNDIEAEKEEHEKRIQRRMDYFILAIGITAAISITVMTIICIINI